MAVKLSARFVQAGALLLALLLGLLFLPLLLQAGRVPDLPHRAVDGRQPAVTLGPARKLRTRKSGC